MWLDSTRRVRGSTVACSFRRSRKRIIKNASDPYRDNCGAQLQNVITSIVIAARRQHVALSIILFLQSNPALALSDEIQLAANYCANYERSVKLSEDGMILCFDGPIYPNAQMEGELQKLNSHGFFVIRSSGGSASVALKIAEILLEKDATVVVYDYCFSACANYILVATRTYVLKDSIVAWHGGVYPDLRCDRYLRGDQSAIGSNTEIHCKTIVLQTDFFQKRGIQPGFIFNPPTPYTRMMFNILASPTRNRTNPALNRSNPEIPTKILWMWNPQNYGDHLKERIIYEHYPNSQNAVDRTIDRLGLRTQVIYDPEL